MDINSASYDPSAEINDGFCTYRYLKTVSVTSMPDILTLEDYETDDVCCWMPDLQFKLVMNRDPELEYYDLVTGIVYEVEDLPVTWDAEITDRYLLTEMEYYYELVDIDWDGEDIFMSGTFIPADAYRDGKIILTDGTGSFEVVLSYAIY